MKTLALLSVMLALPLCAQTPDAKVPVMPTCSTPDACPPVADKNAKPTDPTPLTADEQIDLLITLTDYQGAWLARMQKLADSKAGSQDLKASEDAGQAYMAKLAAMKAKHEVKDTPTVVWVWQFAAKKWVAQPIGGQ